MARQFLSVLPPAHSEPRTLSTYGRHDPPSGPVGPQRYLLKEMVPHSIHAPFYGRECRSRFYNESQKVFRLVSDPKAVDQKAIPMLLFRVAVANVPLDRERRVGTNHLQLPGSIHRCPLAPPLLCDLPPAQAESSHADRWRWLSLALSQQLG